MDDWIIYLGFLLLSSLVIITHAPKSDYPTSLSLTIINTPDIPSHGIISFMTEGQGARISEPFHWDLLEDIPIGEKHLYSAHLDPLYFNRLVYADRIVMETYHLNGMNGEGNWPRRVFTEKQFSLWNITHLHRINAHIDATIEITGESGPGAALVWTTVPETLIQLPHSTRSIWIKRIDDGHRLYKPTGGYREYNVNQALNGTIIVGIDLPAPFVEELPPGPLEKILEKKAQLFNMIFPQEDVFTITTMQASLKGFSEEISHSS